MEIILTAVAGLLTSIVSAGASWFFTRKKYNTEVDQNNIHNMMESLDFYIKLSDDTKRRLDEEVQSNKELRSEVEELKKQVNMLLNLTCTNKDCKSRVK